MRSRVGLTRRGWVFLVASLSAFVNAYVNSLPVLLSVGVLLAALPAVSLLVVWLGRSRLSVVRSFAPAVLEAGRAASVTLVVRNLGRRRSRAAVWRDPIAWQESPQDADLPALAAGGSVSLRYEVHPPRRGVFGVGPLQVEAVDGLGLATGIQWVGPEDHVVVTPQLVPLPETGLSASAGDGESRLVQRRSTGDDDDSITREYRAGDAMRRVHWRATARRGELMVRQEEQRSLPEARIIVDTRLAGYLDAVEGFEDAPAHSESFEWVVRMLASVTVHLRRAGFTARIDETAAPQLGALSRSRRRTWGDEEFLVSLAGLEMSSASGVRRTGSSNGPLIAIVGSPDGPTLEWLESQARSGSVAVAFMVRSVSSVEIMERSFGITSSADTVVGERLTEAGWVVIPVRADDDHVAAWEAVVLETGRGRG